MSKEERGEDRASFVMHRMRMSSAQAMAMGQALADVQAERYRQHAIHGEQDLPLTNVWDRTQSRKGLRAARKHADRTPSFWGLCREELFESGCETDLQKARREWVQTGAVAVQAIEAIDRRLGGVR